MVLVIWICFEAKTYIFLKLWMNGLDCGKTMEGPRLWRHLTQRLFLSAGPASFPPTRRTLQKKMKKNQNILMTLEKVQKVVPLMSTFDCTAALWYVLYPAHSIRGAVATDVSALRFIPHNRRFVSLYWTGLLNRFWDEELILIKPHRVRCVSARVGFRAVIGYPTEYSERIRFYGILKLSICELAHLSALVLPCSSTREKRRSR